MKTITILVNNIELDYVSKTLTLTAENSAFSTSFKVKHTSFPFLIVENKNTIDALGPRDITSINKKKVIQVEILELGKKYTGTLQVISYIKGFRKCNLKYASAILPILKEKIGSFMPTISVIPGENNPVNYVQEATEVIPGYDNWETYPANIIEKVFPQTKIQFPTMRWQDKYGEDLQANDSWFYYENEINKLIFRGDTQQWNMLPNSYSINGNELTVTNKNVASPQVFLLSPLYYAFQSIGFKIKGEFVNNDFIRRVLLLSTKNNLTKIAIKTETQNYTLPTGNFLPTNIVNYTNESSKYVSIFLNAAGDYTLKYNFQVNNIDGVYTTSICKLYLIVPNVDVFTAIYQNIYSPEPNIFNFEGEITFTLPQESVGQELLLQYTHTHAEMPVTHTIEVFRSDSEKEYYQMHPTIDLSRYVPSWSLSEYLNELKKTFNLSIQTNDLKQEIEINFNENININNVPEIINKSLQIKNYDSVANTSFTLAFSNDQDNALFITKNTAEVYTSQTDEFNKEIKNKFKIVPQNNYTAELSEALQDKNGVGLMIYDTSRLPYTSTGYNLKTLSIDGDYGIYATYWKKWLRFRLNATALEIVGPFTETELKKILEKQEIYIDNQHYRIVKTEFKEKTPGINTVNFNLESVNL